MADTSKRKVTKTNVTEKHHISYKVIYKAYTYTWRTIWSLNSAYAHNVNVALNNFS